MLRDKVRNERAELSEKKLEEIYRRNGRKEGKMEGRKEGKKGGKKKEI